ncbi:MAG: EamA family transporter [Eubacteriales bacterium]
MGQVVMTAAYKYCTASVGSVLSMSTALFASFIGIAFLGDKLTLIEGAGAFMIMVGSAYIAYCGAGADSESVNSC